MGYTIKQKIDICLKAEANPHMTQADIANWAKTQYKSSRPPSQTTISRILSCKNELIASKDSDFQLVRRRKQSNPVLRNILSEWVTQAIWENIPMTTPIIQSTANAIWNKLPLDQKDGNGIFSQKWCNEFMRRLNIDIQGDKDDTVEGFENYKLNKIWKLEEKLELKTYLNQLIDKEEYTPQDIFTIDEFQLFYSLPLDQMFDMSSIDKGLKQSSATTEKSLTVMLGCNIDGSERLTPLIVGKNDRIDISKSSNNIIKSMASGHSLKHNVMNKITEVFQIIYKSNSNKWITSSIFQQYLISLEHKIANVSPKRKILILLDDVSSHRIVNLKFKNIRLCYLRNNATHNNPYNTPYNGVQFDYLPMSFGILEEFKILFRLQHYLEMINLERLRSKSNPSTSPTVVDIDNYRSLQDSQNVEVLQEQDYEIPLIKAIEWIKRSWDSIAVNKIFLAWKKTHLFSFAKDWPSKDPRVRSQASTLLQSRLVDLDKYYPNKCYDKLEEVMGYLNVMIPWDIDGILGLVNERGKITFSYVSIEEIIGSFLNDDSGEDQEEKQVEPFQGITPKNNSVLSQWDLIQNGETVLNSDNETLSDNGAQLNDDRSMPANNFVPDISIQTASVGVPPLSEDQRLPNIPFQPQWPTDQREYATRKRPLLNGKQNLSHSSLNEELSSGGNAADSATQNYRSMSNINDTERWGPDRKRKITRGSPFNGLSDTLLDESGKLQALNDSLPSNASPPPFLTSEIQNKGLFSKTLFSGISYKSASNPNLQELRYEGKQLSYYELMKLINKLIDISTNTNILQLSSSTIFELKSNLRDLESKCAVKGTNEE